MMDIVVETLSTLKPPRFPIPDPPIKAGTQGCET